jgi:hypothetical protein
VAAAEHAEAAAGCLWLVGAVNAVVRAAVPHEALAESVVVFLGGGRDAGGGLVETRVAPDYLWALLSRYRRP